MSESSQFINITPMHLQVVRSRILNDSFRAALDQTLDDVEILANGQRLQACKCFLWGDGSNGVLDFEQNAQLRAPNLVGAIETHQVA